MAYEIFWGAGSAYSWRALLALEVMGLSYNSRLLEFSKNEHRSPEMLAMNPRGRLPVLKDGEIAIYESMAILAYLDSKHPDKKLFGSTPEEQGRVWQKVFEIENYLRDPVYDVVAPIFFDNVDDSIDSIEKSISYVHAEFKALEELLHQQDYLAGNTISAADIALFPLISSLQRAMTFKSAENLDQKLHQLNEYYPEIFSWIKRIEAIPGYDNTYPPNWTD